MSRLKTPSTHSGMLWQQLENIDLASTRTKLGCTRLDWAQQWPCTWENVLFTPSCLLDDGRYIHKQVMEFSQNAARKMLMYQTFATSLTLTGKSQEMILDSATIQTILKQDGMLVLTCFIKPLFLLSLFIHRQTHNPSVWTIWWWKCTDCQSGIGGGGKLVFGAPISNPS